MLTIQSVKSTIIFSEINNLQSVISYFLIHCKNKTAKISFLMKFLLQIVTKKGKTGNKFAVLPFTLFSFIVFRFVFVRCKKSSFGCLKSW